MKTVGACLCLFLLVVSIPVVVAPPGHIIGSASSDIGFAHSWHCFVGRELARGTLPLWNPHVLGGVPLLANLQAALLYPPYLLLRWLLPDSRGFNLLVLGHYLLAAAGAALHARQLGASRAGQVVAGITFAWSGPLVARVAVGHQPILAVYAWCGFIFTALLHLERAPAPGTVLLTGGVLAVAGLAGHVQIWYYLLLAAAANWLVMLASAARRRDWRRCARLALAFPAAVLFALLLTAPQLLPTCELAKLSSRAALPRAEAGAFALTPEALLSVCLPEPFGNGTTVAYWGRYYPWELCLYGGLVALLLAVAAIAGLRRLSGGWHGRFLIGLAVGALLFALGDRTPLFALALDWLPGFAMLRGHAKLAGLFLFALAILAGLGVDIFLTMRRRRSIGLSATATLLMLLLIPMVAPDHPVWQTVLHAMAAVHTPYTPSFSPTDSVFAAAAAGLVRKQLYFAALLAGLLALVPLVPVRLRRATLVGLVALDIGVFATRYCGTVPTTLPPGVARLLALLPEAGHEPYRLHAPELGNSFGIRERLEVVQGNDILLIDDTFRYLLAAAGITNAVEYTSTPPLNRYSPLTERLNLRFVLGTSAVAPPGWREVAAADGWHLWEAPSWLPRFSLTGVTAVMPHAAMLPALADAAAGDTVLLEQPLAAPLTGRHGTCRLLHCEPGRVLVSTVTDGSMLLVERSSYFPGWQATVDGQPETVLRVDYRFRGVRVPPGAHLVELRYAPASLRRGVMLAGLGLLGAALGSWLGRRRRQGGTRLLRE